MENPMLSPDSKTGKAENMIQEYAEKVAKALEMETNRLKEKTEQDSSRIIAEARQKADEIIAQARHEAKTVSDKMIAGTKEESEQILRDSLEKATNEAQHVSARIVKETREKIVQTLTDVIDGGMAKAKSEFVHTASESRKNLESETSKLLGFTESISAIISETETKIQAGFEQLDSVLVEIKNNLRPANELPESDIVKESQHISVISGNTTRAEKLEKQEIGQPTVENAAIMSKKAIKSEQVETLKKPEPEQPTKEQETVKIEVVKKPQTSDDASIWMKKGLFLLERTKTKEAIEAFNEVIKLEPKNALAWRKKGAALGRLGKYNDALKAFTKAIELDPKDVTAWQNKVVALVKLGRKAEAEEAKKGEKQAQQAAKK